MNETQPSILSRQRPPEREAAARRKAEIEGRIVGATEALLAEGRAFAELTVGQITKRAGLARSAFYTHFPDKRALILHLATERSAGLIEFARAMPVGPMADVRTSFAQQIRLASIPYTQEPHITRALFEAASYDDVVREWWDEKVQSLTEVAQRQIEFAQANGRMLGLDPKLATYAMYWMVHETLNQEFIQHSRFDPDDVIDTLVEIIARLLLASPADADGGAAAPSSP